VIWIKLAPGLVGVGILLGGLAPLAAQEQMPNMKVDLPPSPEFKPTTTPEKYPDGKWSVHGVRKQAKTTMGQEVEVKGYILEIYECPPERAKCTSKKYKGPPCKACDQPHYYLSDKKEGGKKDKAMLVANYPIKPKPPKMPPAGTEVVVTGTFTREAGGFASSDGILDHKKTVTSDKPDKPIVEGNVFAGAAEELQKKIQAAEGKGKPPKRR
jgi:hypothetical protein